MLFTHLYLVVAYTHHYARNGHRRPGRRSALDRALGIMTERKSTDDGEGRKPPATDDGQGRRTFLGAAAALSTLPTIFANTNDDGAGDEDERTILDDGRGRRYEDGDYGSSTLDLEALGVVEHDEHTSRAVDLTVRRACDGASLRFDMGTISLDVSLSPDGVRRLREELRYAEAQIVEKDTDAE